MLIPENFIDICSILSNIAIVITMIYSIIKLRQDKRSVIADIEWRRKNETILFSHEILEKTDNLISEINNKFPDNETINVSDLKKSENSELSHVIFKYLTLMERLSVGLNTGVYDLDVYARICRSKTINAWDRLKNIAYDKRKSSGNSNLYIEFENMVNRLVERDPKQLADTRGDYKEME